MRHIIKRFPLHIHPRAIAPGLLYLIAVTTASASDIIHEEEGIYYKILDESSVEVSAAPDGTYDVEHFVIPAEVKIGDASYEVVGIGDKAFYSNLTLRSVVLPPSLRKIGSRAFAHCESLETVELPESLTEIGDNAFAYCFSMGPEITLDNYIAVGDGAFSYCASLESLDAEGFDGIFGAHSFMGCTGLKTVSLNPLIETLPDFSFSDCKELLEIRLPDNLRVIGNHAFSNCTSLQEITIPRHVQLIGDRAFNKCMAVSKLEFLCSEAEIGEGAFEHLSNLPSLYINGVNTVGDYGFAYCESLQWVEIESGTEEIGAHAFSGCRDLKAVYCHSDWPPKIGVTTFDTSTEQNADLIVNEGSAGRYGLAAYWDRFVHISESEVFPVSVKEVTDHIDQGLPELFRDGNFLYVMHSGEVHLLSLQGGEVAGSREGSYTRFPSIPGIYILLMDEGAFKIFVK